MEFPSVLAWRGRPYRPRDKSVRECHQKCRALRPSRSRGQKDGEQRPREFLLARRNRRRISRNCLKHGRHRAVERQCYSLLGDRTPIPRIVKRNEDAIPVARWEFLPVVAHHSVRCPMRWKCSDRAYLVRVDAHRFATIATVVLSKHELLLHAVVVAPGPALISAESQHQQFFSWQRSLLFGLVKSGPVRMELIAAMLGHKQVPVRIEGKALCVANPGCVTFRR